MLSLLVERHRMRCDYLCFPRRRAVLRVLAERSIAIVTGCRLLPPEELPTERAQLVFTDGDSTDRFSGLPACTAGTPRNGTGSDNAPIAEPQPPVTNAMEEAVRVGD